MSEETTQTNENLKKEFYSKEPLEGFHFDDEDEEGQDGSDETGEADSETSGDTIIVQSASHALSLSDAAKVLGSSVRALERGIIGKWGKKLPEGWTARKFRISGRDEWRIIPPPGFRVRIREQAPSASDYKETVDEVKDTVYEVKETARVLFERLINSSKQAVRNELMKPEGQPKALPQLVEQPMIVIDRSDEVERLLRELAETQKELAEERKQHLDDMRLIAQMQNSMRLLEVNAQHTAVLKDELTLAKDALTEHRRQYQEFLALPWWKRVFKSSP